MSAPANITINARWDQANEKYIVLWKDIQQVFKTAQYIKNDNVLVPFMMNAQFENLVPERIAYHPDVVLDVIVDSSTILASDECNATNDKGEQLQEADRFANEETCQNSLIDGQITALTMYSVPGRPSPVVGIMNSMYEHFRNLELEMENNRVFRADVRDNLRQVNDRLAVIQDRIQAVFTQTYELHEYPIPRLFIVLPKVTKRRDKLYKPFMKQFRLYFLCECGEHTRTKESKIPHEIHLAKHDGYDLDKPNEFFEKYGSYVLTMMQMIKYGFAAAGVVVPGLSHFGVPEGIDIILRNLQTAQSNLGTLVDETIKYIECKKFSTSYEPNAIADSYELSKHEVVEGADLRQLESYLSIHDQGRVLGNLYRTVTHEGKVKWVCMDHYRENYRESVIQQLRDVIDSNDGYFDEKYGRVSITIASKQTAKQFYDALAKARAIHELDISLAWDVTFDDLRTLETAVKTASIVHLKIDGGCFRGPKRDIMNIGRRFDPIVNLIFNGRMQSLQLERFEEFYQHISGSSPINASQFRVLSIDSLLSSKDRSAMSVFKKILDKCPSLTELAIRGDNILNILDCVIEKYCDRQLDTLVLKFSESTIAVGFSRGSIQTVQADLARLSDSDDQPSFFGKGLLTDLTAKHFRPSTSDLSQLQKILEQNPKIADIKIATRPGNFHCIAGLVTEIREKMLSEERGVDLRQLRLQTYDIGKDGQGEQENTITMTLDFSDPNLEIVSSTDVVFCSSTTSQDTEITEFLNIYGWSIKNLVANRSFSDHHVKTIVNSTERSRCGLRSLRFDPTSLSPDGLQSMDLIYDRSDNLENLVMGFQDLHVPEHRDKAARSLILYGTQLNGLTLSGDFASEWIPEIKSSLPTRYSLLKLESFGVICSEIQSIPSSCVEWFIDMLQAPPVLSPTDQSSRLLTKNNGYFSTWSALRDIRLEYMELSFTDWSLIIGALEFSKLESLSFENTNFSLDEFECLLESMPIDEAKISLKVFYVKNTYLVKCDDEFLQDLKADFEGKTFGATLDV
ncbi:hypothetical protein BGZ80_005860 [Entomortierella chlamydospora]|uniref:Uncharacterized protein n=1 Tax=Entomortierella chlamydospora TaxID=101097 RepID=A0A9P6MZ85_9FUNG|nr:hypothetical protein BGZ80_005860 [Entomortierella chlamydospora]